MNTMSNKGRSAVLAMTDLALHGRAGPLALALIAERQRVSLSYMEQVFAKLRRHGLVESTRGPGGGYSLGRRAEDISVGDIVAAVDDEEPARTDGDPLAALCADVDAVLMRHLEGISLHSLVKDRRPSPLPGRTAGRTGLRESGAPAAPRPLAPNSVFAFGLSFAR